MDSEKSKHQVGAWTMIDVTLGSGLVLLMLGITFLTYQIQVHSATLPLAGISIALIIWLYRGMAHIRPMDAQDRVEGRIKIFATFGLVISTLILAPIALMTMQGWVLYRNPILVLIMGIAFITWLVLVFFFARRFRRTDESFEDYQRRLGFIRPVTPVQTEYPSRKREGIVVTPVEERQRRLVLQPQPIKMTWLLIEIVWLSLMILLALGFTIRYLLEAEYLMGFFSIGQILLLAFLIYFNIHFLQKSFKNQDLTGFTAVGLVLFLGIVAILVIWGWPVLQANPGLGNWLLPLLYVSMAFSSVLHRFRSLELKKMR